MKTLIINTIAWAGAFAFTLWQESLGAFELGSKLECNIAFITCAVLAMIAFADLIELIVELFKGVGGDN